jgi:hypothetical protein
MRLAALHWIDRQRKIAKPAQCTNTGGPLTNQQLECVMAKSNLTADKLRELVDYDPETGIFRRRTMAGNGTIPAGSVCGCLDKSTGYVKIFVAGRSRLAHRIAWLYVHGDWPYIIDHKNGNPSDNRIANLRNVSFQENVENRRLRTPNSSGYLGVVFEPDHPTVMKYRAAIVFQDKGIHLGRFRTASEAAAAYHGAKIILHRGYLPGPGIEQQPHV